MLKSSLKILQSRSFIASSDLSDQCTSSGFSFFLNNTTPLRLILNTRLFDLLQFLHRIFYPFLDVNDQFLQYNHDLIIDLYVGLHRWDQLLSYTCLLRHSIQIQTFYYQFS